MSPIFWIPPPPSFLLGRLSCQKNVLHLGDISHIRGGGGGWSTPLPLKKVNFSFDALREDTPKTNIFLVVGSLRSAPPIQLYWFILFIFFYEKFLMLNSFKIMINCMPPHPPFLLLLKNDFFFSLQPLNIKKFFFQWSDHFFFYKWRKFNRKLYNKNIILWSTTF